MKFIRKFKEDFNTLKKHIQSKQKFAFSKYADGEWFILNNTRLTNIDNWTYDPATDSLFSKMLLDSLKYKDRDYYIGISCKCCDPIKSVWYLNNINSSNDNVTFANIFVNGNYPLFKNEMLPLFNSYQNVFLIANKLSRLENLKNVLKLDDFFGIDKEAFKTNLGIIDKLIKHSEHIKDSLYLFSAGPLGNVLAHRLWESNKNNTYIDIGSTLNLWLNDNIRCYQLPGTIFTERECYF